MTTINHYSEELADELSRLAERSYQQSRLSGFHDSDHLDDFLAMPHEQQAKVMAELQDTKRLFLAVGELVEALEELRAGHAPTETYYTLSRDYSYMSAAKGVSFGGAKGGSCSADDKARMEAADPEGTVGLFKPEGVPAEIADTLIRIADYCFTRGINLGEAVNEKAAFNATRARLHGRKF